MSLFIVRRENAFYPISTWLEDGDDGMFEPVKVVTDATGTKVVAYYGLSVPVEAVREHVVQIFSQGYDHQAIKEELTVAN